jgi:hypothetical protein
MLTVLLEYEVCRLIDGAEGVGGCFGILGMLIPRSYCYLRGYGVKCSWDMGIIIYKPPDIRSPKTSQINIIDGKVRVKKVRSDFQEFIV